jgi:hypothetical protein
MWLWELSVVDSARVVEKEEVADIEKVFDARKQ